MKSTRRHSILVLLLMALSLTGCSSDNFVAPENIPGSNLPPLVEIPFSIGADEYLNHRFFVLDLPHLESSGRVGQELIDPMSVKVWKHLDPGPISPHEISYVATYVDSTGYRTWQDLDFQEPSFAGARWMEISFSPLINADGYFWAIDLGECYNPTDIMAVTYDVIQPDGTLVARVGDVPGIDVPTLILDPYGLRRYYRMKLLKPSSDHIHPHVFQYVLRNRYSLGARHLECESFDLQIEALTGEPHPELVADSLPWLRVFGLDQWGADGSVPDGIIDEYYVDLHKGLLCFPLDFPHPFAAEPDQYLANADPGSFVWENSYLAQNLMPQIYDPAVHSDDYSQYRTFMITGHVQKYDLSGVLDEAVPMSRLDWSWASAPAQMLFGEQQFHPEGRVENLRWFLPRERSLRRYINPNLTGGSAEETLTVLDMFLRDESTLWDSSTWGGIMSSVGPYGADLSGFSEMEIWVNDGVPDREERSGTLHIDFGFISEDGFWPVVVETGGLIIGSWEQEDGILNSPPSPDFVWLQSEDVGLNYQAPEGDPTGLQEFSLDYGSAANPYPQINGTAHNNQEDSEDLNGNTRLDRDNGYFTYAIYLKETDAFVDVVYDYDGVDDLIADGHAWRLYKVNLADFNAVVASVNVDLTRVSHLRLWYENQSRSAPATVHLQFSGLKFLR